MVIDMNSKLDLREVIKYAGATIALLIGSGFATGQEILQYFVAHGLKGILVVIVLFLLLSFVIYELISTGYHYKFEEGNDIYYYYGGKYIGKFYDYFSTLFLFLSFIVMVAGAGATINEQLGLPTFVGTILLGAMVILAGLMGLNKITEIIGKIGPAVILIVICLGLYSIFNNLDGIKSISENLDTYKLLKASDKWYLGALSYVGFNMLWLMVFVSQMGKDAKTKAMISKSALVGSFAFSLGTLILYLGLLAALPKIHGSQIPNLALAQEIGPAFSTVFSLLIFIEIFTTSVPLLWSVVTRLTDEGTKNYKIAVIALGVLGILAGNLISFEKLVNIVYVINGYIGLFLLLLMIYKFIQVRRRGYEKFTKVL